MPMFVIIVLFLDICMYFSTNRGSRDQTLRKWSECMNVKGREKGKKVPVEGFCGSVQTVKSPPLSKMPQHSVVRPLLGK